MQKMNRWLTLVANLGVLAGLFILIYEVDQNTSALRNEADIAIWSIAAGQAMTVVEHPEVAGLLVRAETEALDSFSPVEQLRLRVFWGSLIDRLELQFQLADRYGELLDRDSIVFPERYFGFESFRAHWESGKSVYHPKFIAYFEQLMVDR